MAKRKTREQKAIADQRHILYHLDSSSAQVSLPSVKKSDLELNIPSSKLQATSYTYVTKDLRKTASITLSILTTQIVLFFVLNRV